jgi:hypothetical protein
LVDPHAILAEIHPGKETEAVVKLFDQPGRWNAVLDGVASAEQTWLDVAEALRPGTDAHSSETLGMALAEAFLRAPARVLRRFGPETACGSMGFADQSDMNLPDIRRLWERRRAAAAAIAAPDLAMAKKHCLAELDTIKGYLK